MDKTSRGVRRAMAAIRAVVVSLVVLTLLGALSVLFVPKDNREAFGMKDEKANGVLGEPDNTIDVLFIGDSEAYSAFSPLQMWGEQGFTSYVCATGGQELPYTNTFLHRATLKQKPLVVVIETDAVYREFRPGVTIMRLLQDVFPVFEYHDRWKSLGWADITTFPQATWTDGLKGFVPSGTVKAADDTGHMAPNNDVEEIPLLNRCYLLVMISRCRAIGAELVLISTPSTKNWSTARHNGIAEFADKAGVNYVDLNTGADKVSIDWKTDTRDEGDHLNTAGAAKVSSYVGAYLSSKYKLPDHRKEEEFSPWNKAFDKYNATATAGQHP